MEESKKLRGSIKITVISKRERQNFKPEYSEIKNNASR